MMIQSRMIGDAKVTRVLEYTGPTHSPAFLLPEMPQETLQANGSWMAPNHWVPAMNKLVLTVQFWVVHAGGNIIVVDTGVGNFKPREGIPRMNMLNTLVPEWLEAAGAHPDKVTHVALTHLHIDHVGWCTRWQDGRWTPTFQNAKYFLPKDDFLFCKTGRNKVEGMDVFGDAFFDSVMPVFDAGLSQMIAPGMEIADCLLAEAAPGHSPGQVTYRLRSRGEEAIFSGDVLHNPMQIAHPEFNSGYCIWSDQARTTRLNLLNAAADRNALVLPVHFGDPYCGFVRREGQGFRYEPAAW